MRSFLPGVCFLPMHTKITQVMVVNRFTIYDVYKTRSKLDRSVELQYKL